MFGSKNYLILIEYLIEAPQTFIINSHHMYVVIIIKVSGILITPRFKLYNQNLLEITQFKIFKSTQIIIVTII